MPHPPIHPAGGGRSVHDSPFLHEALAVTMTQSPESDPSSAADPCSLLTPALFRAAMDASSIGAALSDLRLPDQPLVYVNPAFERMTGYVGAQVYGRNCRFLQGVEHDQPEVARIREAIAAHRTLTVRLRNYRRDGSLFWNELTLSPLYDTDGQLTHYVGFQKDVSEEQRALEALARRDAESRALLDTTPAAMVAADLQSHRIVYANRQFEALTGRPAPELIGSDPMLLHPPTDRAQIAQTFLAMAAGQLDLAADVPVQLPDGRVLPVHVRASHGELAGRPTLFAVFADQRARRAAEMDAGRQLARLAAVLAAHPDEVLVLDAQGRLVEAVRPGWIAGLLSLGGCLCDVLPERVNAPIHVGLQRVTAATVPVTLDFVHTIADEPRHYELRLLPLPGPQVLALIRDVSESRRAVQALAASEAEFRQLFEALPQGVVYQGADGHILRANPAACRLLGLSMDQLLGRESTDPRWRAIREDGFPFPGSEHPAMLSLATGKPVEGVTMGIYHPQREDYVWLLVSAIPEFREGQPRPWRVFASFVDISAQRRAAADLGQYNDLIEQAGRLARIGVWQLEVPSGSVTWSAVTREIHEVPATFKPDLGNSLAFYVEGDSRERIQSAVQRAMTTGEDYDEELEIRSFRGRRRWVRTIGHAVFEHGACVRVYGTFHDITDSHERLRQLTRQSELQQLLMDIATTYINLPLEQLDHAIRQSLAQLGEFSGADRFYVFRYDFERMVTSNTHEWCAPGVQPQLPMLQDYSLEGMPAWVEVHRQGRPMQIDDVRALPAEDALRRALELQGIRTMLALPLMQDGICIGFVGMDFVHAPHRVSDTETQLLKVFAEMLVNVNIRQSMLRELTENRNFLVDVIENSGSLISIKDLEGHYLSVNQRWEAVFGLPREAVVGRADEELFAADLASILQTCDQAVIRGGRLRESKEELKTPSGPRYFYTVRFPVRDRDGHVYGVAAMATDITERERLEEERQARALAETANREKSAFLARMSHEIRTPLNAIIGFSRRLMEDRSLQVKSAEQIRTVHRSATHLLSMINDLLDYSRIEAGRISLQETDFDLRGMLEDLAAMFRFRCEEKRLAFLFHWDSALPTRACGDAGKLRQIVMNLLGNAVKFTTAGHVSMRARRAAGHAEAFKLEIEVEDSGAGIGADELPHLFDEFWQGRAGLMAGGTGLGLPIAQQLLKLLGGGPIQVQSVPGRGSSFRCLLPLRLVSAFPDDSAAGPVVAEKSDRTPPLPPAETEVRQALAAQSAHSLAQLRDALSRGEMSLFRELLGGLSLTDAIRAMLLDLAAQYDYARLGRLFGEDDPSQGEGG